MAECHLYYLDRTNSLYKSVIIDASDITLKYNGNDALTIANTGEATFASNVLSLGNISSTRTISFRSNF
jgi:hypothetical protein